MPSGYGAARAAERSW
ncbi:hypothetical protein AYI68_g4891, partial [Smittium mucronatum]